MATAREYHASTDYLRVRQFLIDTFTLYGRPFNWMLDQWNFCRYFAAPVHVFYTARHFSVPKPANPQYRDEVTAWEKTVRIWENELGEIVGVVNSENEEPGDAFVQTHPDYESLSGEMLDYIEDGLADEGDGVRFVKVYANRGSSLESIAEARGYRRLRVIPHLEYSVTGEETSVLPEGFVMKSVADHDDIEARRRAKAMAFGHDYGPSNWPPAWAFQEMQKAFDYRRELDLYIEAPNGDCAAFCTMWVDEKNRYANIEPLGTMPEYQGKGLAGALCAEAFRRAARFGADRSYMQSSNPFYRKIGFRETDYAYSPWIKHWGLDKRI